MKKLLDVLELSDCWKERNNITSKTLFVWAVKKKLKKTFIQAWEKQMATFNNMNSELDIYKKIKTIFTLEQYLLDIKNGDTWRNETRFRISAHKFRLKSNDI